MCNKCGNGPFLSDRNLERHVATAHFGRHYRCKRCEFRIVSLSGQLAHTNAFGCDDFEVVWLERPEKWDLLDALVDYSQEHSTLSECPIRGCGQRGTSQKIYLEDHIACNHMERRYACTACDCKSFKRRISARKHVEKKHKDLVDAGRNVNSFLNEHWGGNRRFG